jgi:hypothetical protein
MASGNGGTATGTATIVNNDSYKVKLVGDGALHEGGNAGNYRVELNTISDKDRFFSIDIHDGTAKRIDATSDTYLGKATMPKATGNPVSTVGNQQVAKFYSKYGINGWQYENIESKGYQVRDDKDFTVFKNGALNKGNTITVKVAAGQQVSESFQINAWKENVIAPYSLANSSTPTSEIYDYYHYRHYVGTAANSPEAKQVKEGNETFKLKIANAGDAQIEQGTLDVQINDKSKVLYISPLAVDLNGDGIKTISIDAGVQFDMNNTGTKVSTGWISAGDAFLAVDENDNGQIDNRSELFGGGVGEGFAKLATFDSNDDGVVNSNDTDFDRILVWQDNNSNGITDAGELNSLNAMGINDVNVTHDKDNFTVDSQGNILGERGTVITTTGASLEMIDVYFQSGI